MNSLKLGLPLVAALAIGGVAMAQQGGGPMGAGPMAAGGATVTRAQMQAHAAQMFDRLDANRDGKIDQADREARRAAMFDRIDADHNGQISKAEFTAAGPMRGGPGGPDGAMQGAGKPGMGGMRGRGMGRMMLRMADANRDGTVTKDEFAAAAAQHFDHMDANKDGQVTGEERRAMRQSMRQRMQGQMGHDMSGHEMGGPAVPQPKGN